MAAIEVRSSDCIFSHAQILQELGIKNKDSLHVACAIAGGADRFFATDDRLLNKKALIPDRKIENPVDFTINESSND